MKRPPGKDATGLGRPPVEIMMKSKASGAVTQLATKAELVTLRLIRCETSFHPDRMSEGDDIVISVEKAQFKADGPSASGGLDCGVRFTLRMHPKEKDGDPVAEVFAEYNLIYRLQDKVTCTNRDVHQFVKTTGVFNAWPFFRELVSSLVSKMGLPLLVIPLFRLPLTMQAGSF
jgi:hypothetical protein